MIINEKYSYQTIATCSSAKHQVSLILHNDHSFSDAQSYLDYTLITGRLIYTNLLYFQNFQSDKSVHVREKSGLNKVGNHFDCRDLQSRTL